MAQAPGGGAVTVLRVRIRYPQGRNYVTVQAIVFVGLLTLMLYAFLEQLLLSRMEILLRIESVDGENIEFFSEQHVEFGSGRMMSPGRVLLGCYHSNYSHRVERCLGYLRNNQSDYLRKLPGKQVCSSKRPMLFHTLYSRRVLHALRLHVMSFLATQRLECCLLTLWMYVPSEVAVGDQLEELLAMTKSAVGDLLAAFPGNVRISTWRPFTGSWPDHGAWLRQHVIATCSKNLCHSDVAHSDMVRLAILWLHGGTYVDIDSIYLRDTQPLWNLDYAYEWGRLHWELYNNAVLSLRRHSCIARSLLEEGARHNCSFGPKQFGSYLTAVHGSDVNLVVNGRPVNTSRGFLLRLPVALFDFLWLDTAKEVISTLSELHDFHDLWKSFETSNWTDRLRFFFNRSFILHYHDSRIARKLRSNSYMGALYRIFEKRVHILTAGTSRNSRSPRS